MLRKTLLVLALGSALVACGKGGPGKDAADADSKKVVSLAVAPEDVMTVRSDALLSGPVITGSVLPERRADVRAEVSAVVMQVLKENGDPVKKGDLLVRLDDTAIRDAMSSADQSLRSSQQAYDQAGRTLERLKTLRASGMTSAQALDDAVVRLNNAQADLAGARSRAVAARQQLSRTSVRAPFDGVVSDRQVSAGDTAAIGKQLLKVVDPSSVRFEGRISADKVSQVKAGQPVIFHINGYGEQDFKGVVRRVDPSANDVTREVEVLVAFTPDSPRPHVSGLYAEGTIASDSKAALMLPENAVVKSGDRAYTWRIKGKQLAKADLQLGQRDPRTGYYEVKSGLAAGDVVMRNPSSGFKDGQKVDMTAPKVVASAAPAQGK